MRDRMIRESFWSDIKTCALSTDAQLVFIGLWGCASDLGILPDDPHLLKNEIDKRSTRWAMEKFKKCIAEITQQNLLFPFTHKNEGWYFIPSFTRHQRGIRRPRDLGYPEPPSDYLTTPAGQCPSSDGQTLDNVQTLSVKCPPEVEGKRREGEVTKQKLLDCILMTEDQYQNLLSALGRKNTEVYIQKVNDYVMSKGVKYKSHYHTVLAWARKDGITINDEKTKERTHEVRGGIAI